jgi:Na+-transporting NADH:ubiquinone oxidoreductase subunit A
MLEKQIPISQEQGKCIQIKKGLDLPITGQPDLDVIETGRVRRVAVIGTDYAGVKPTMAVQAGERVKLGQLLFADKKNPGVRFTSPASGTVVDIHRGEKRILQSVIIEADDGEGGNAPTYPVDRFAEETFGSYSVDRLANLSPGEAKGNLLASGLWTALRTRPYGKIPSPDSSPHSLFVNAMDTNPLAAPPRLAIQGREDDFKNGLSAISNLTDGKLYLCHHPEDSLPGSDFDFVTSVAFEGPHPSGLVGTHIHFLDPVSARKTVWHLNLQDVIAIGFLFRTGRIDVRRLMSLGGSMIARPRLLRTQIGASIDDLLAGELRDRGREEIRVISGSVLYGNLAVGPFAFLGRYHHQISVISENRSRQFLDWHRPGFDRFSVTNTFISKQIRGIKFPFTTSTGGGERPMVPIGVFERVMPMDMLITPLLRALMVGDTDQAQALGCLELDEEDLALSTFVCPGKEDYCSILSRNLTTIETEG